ncbi:class I SAM-dependent methyltransferase [Nocardioides sp.]|uniref:class I SAM-dependent methyltransferase n=1 Tax=Nocardioides sp. TaxID=35761 RepID=UPI001A1CB835|nr:class I SAM-dependent methyltransferase [Nocardioides sp.]MBJ7356597.1 class I SAM-dependent methyltransferase [Nocardioides sp.]
MSEHLSWSELADERGLAAVADGDPTRWYEEVWSAGARGAVPMPWDRDEPHDLLEWHTRGVDGTGRRAVVVGAGLGADAEHLAGLGFTTTAFDIAPSAVDSARERHPGSRVDYRVADLLDLPEDLVGAFDLVVEIFTLQALHGSVRERAAHGVRRLVAPGGTVLVVQVVRDDDEEVAAEPPWLLDRAEMEALAGDDLVTTSLDRVPNPEHPDARDLWRMLLRRDGR